MLGKLQSGLRPTHLGEPAFPGERVAHDRVKFVELRRPAERYPDTGAVGDDRRRVAGTAAREPHGKVAAAHALDRLDYLADRIAVAIAAVEGFVPAAPAQIGKRGR